MKWTIYKRVFELTVVSGVGSADGLRPAPVRGGAEPGAVALRLAARHCVIQCLGRTGQLHLNTLPKTVHTYTVFR